MADRREIDPPHAVAPRIAAGFARRAIVQADRRSDNPAACPADARDPHTPLTVRRMTGVRRIMGLHATCGRVERVADAADKPDMLPVRFIRPGHKAEGLEKRRAPRRPHACRAWIASPTARTEAEWVEVAGTNLSRHGIGFTSAVPVAEGSFVLLRLGLGVQQITSELRVAQCRKLSDPDRYEIGAEFC